MKAARVNKLKKLDAYMVEYTSISNKYNNSDKIIEPMPVRYIELRSLIDDMLKELYNT